MIATPVPRDPRGEGPDAPSHLTGCLKPVFEEVTLTELEVVGEIPRELNGRYFRNTANPRTGYSAHWFTGDGMIHGVELREGRANWYRNRWVRTPLFEHPGEDRMKLALNMQNFTVDHSVSTANTHIIGHGGRILALEEGAFPYEMTRELDTIGAYTFGGMLSGPFTAHPKICPDTGEMLAFGYAQVPPYLTYFRISASGEMLQKTPITVTGPTMMHDMAATRTHAIFLDLPAIFDMQAAMSGGIPIRWSDDYPARLGVMPREGTDADVQWFHVAPSYCFHTLNAYQNGDEVVVVGFRVPEIWRNSTDMSKGSSDRSRHPRLYEWRLNLVSGAVKERYLDDQSGEFPRISPTVQGKYNRFGYSISAELSETYATNAGNATTTVKYDFENGARRELHQYPVGHQPGEAVFVPREGSTSEDDGYLMTFVWKQETDTSYMVILDAQNIAAKPIAEIHIPRRVVSGFHTSWIPDPR